MIIEFIGIPGAGKTAARDLLVQHLRNSNRTVYDRKMLEILLYGGCFRLYFFYLKIIARLIYAHIVSGDYRGLLNCYYFRVAYWAFKDIYLLECLVSKNPLKEGELYIPEEGLAQHILAATVWSNRSDLFFSRFSQILRSELVLVNMETDLEQALARINQRGYPETWPQKFRNEQLAAELLKSFAAKKSEVLAKFSEAGGVAYSIDNTGTIDELNMNLQALLKELGCAAAVR
ncbi:MAG: hypothetical protein D6719_06220 [Candidatus Dadabacteria bacterium]|nr:MAG: hypothetical protein D6719_06220 [Candidatus Dadabacteria bacterium]